GKVRPVERHREEEAQRRNRAVDARRLDAALRLVQLVATQILRRRRIGRPADEGRERAHLANVVAARLFGEAAHRHVFDHARTQRADGPGRRSGGHRGGPLRAEGCWTFDARDRMPRSSPLTAQPLTATAKNAPASTPPSRESGFVLCHASALGSAAGEGGLWLQSGITWPLPADLLVQGLILLLQRQEGG